MSRKSPHEVEWVNIRKKADLKADKDEDSGSATGTRCLVAKAWHLKCRGPGFDTK